MEISTTEARDESRRCILMKMTEGFNLDENKDQRVPLAVQKAITTIDESN